MSIFVKKMPQLKFGREKFNKDCEGRGILKLDIQKFSFIPWSGGSTISTGESLQLPYPVIS